MIGVNEIRDKRLCTSGAAKIAPSSAKNEVVVIKISTFYFSPAGHLQQ